jgi:nitroreductase
MKTALVRAWQVLQVFTEYLRDGWSFLRYNRYSPFEPRGKRIGHATVIKAHTVEKGLALPRPRSYFGLDKIRELLDMNAGWSPPQDDLPRSMLLGALRDYRQAFGDVDAPDSCLIRRIDSFLDTPETVLAQGGVRTFFDHPVRDDAAVAFLGRRCSVRDFAPQPLTDDEIKVVVALAQRAPSQCNRQATRVHVYRDRSLIDKLLELQGGGRGFSDKVPTLFVVTSEITAWGGPQQRNQPYVDGGIFSTMLLLALDANGFVSCPMNLAILHRTEQAIRHLGDIPSRERLVVMVAAGRPPAGAFRAARSPRYPVTEICRIHNANTG